jgi:pimeloyl-ACP methyl ester carboxylesterase
VTRSKAHKPNGPVEIGYHDGPLGRVRSRSVGRSVAGMPDVVLVQGLGVADYLIPALTRLGRVTRAHLLDLPGLAGAGDPPHQLRLPGYAAAVGDWLAARTTHPVLLAGHSAGTQIAAHAAISPASPVCGLVLASPTVDPVARSWPRLCAWFVRDGRHERPGLTSSHLPEWRRAGPRRLYRLTADCLADELEGTVSRVRVPVLVLRGGEDRLSTAGWAGELVAAGAPGSRYVELPGAHSFVWAHPDAWVEPVRGFGQAAALGRISSA